MFSPKIASRFLVYAFTSPPTSRSSKMCVQRIGALDQVSQQRRLSALGVTQVEEDLDAALDNLLGDAFLEAGDPRDLETEAHMKDSHPIPAALVEQVS